jgi:4-amino-4-deoxy-L-arabinose transferase-like glycosyltransferase
MNRQIGSLDPLLINWLAVALTLGGSVWTGWLLLSGEGKGVWLVLLFLTFSAGFLYRVIELGKVLKAACR